jgi:hypothetical protein
MLNKEVFLPTIGKALDNLGNSYQIFLSSASKKEKIQSLWEIRMAAIDVNKTSKKLLEYLTSQISGPDPNISPVMADAVKKVTRGNLHMQVLNLDHLAKLFVIGNLEDKRLEEEKRRDKIQLLYQIHHVSADIADTALTTSAEPDRGTERA